MRLSTDYYPEYVYYHCTSCENDVASLVDSIEGDDVRVFCPNQDCQEVSYVRVIED